MHNEKPSGAVARQYHLQVVEGLEMGVGPRINEVLQEAREALAGKGERR